MNEMQIPLGSRKMGDQQMFSTTQGLRSKVYMWQEATIETVGKKDQTSSGKWI